MTWFGISHFFSLCCLHPSPWADILHHSNNLIWHWSFLLSLAVLALIKPLRHPWFCLSFGSLFSYTLGETFYISLVTWFGIGHFLVSAWMLFIYPAGWDICWPHKPEMVLAFLLLASDYYCLNDHWGIYSCNMSITQSHVICFSFLPAAV